MSCRRLISSAGMAFSPSCTGETSSLRSQPGRSDGLGYRLRPGGDCGPRRHELHPRASRLSAELFEVIQRDLGALERRDRVLLFLDDVPFRATDGPAELEDLGPLDVAFADHGLGVRGGEFLEMHGDGPAGITPQTKHRIGAAAPRIAGVDLQ